MAREKTARKIRFVLNTITLILVCGLCSCAGMQRGMSVGEKQLTEEINVMGDWQGSQMLNYSVKSPLVAQVIALGDGKYRANLLPEFDKRVEPLAVLDGQTRGKAVYFSEPNQPAGGIQWEGVIENGKFSGSFRGAEWGSFTMDKVIRLSPELGAKPPQGAVVLFNGTNLDQWEPAQPPGLVPIYDVIGKSKAAAAYIRCEVYSEKEQQAMLELGSHDGVKVWLNGEVVYSNNIIRMWKPNEDKATVTLKEGWNTLMMKITIKGWLWSASARFVDDEGKPLYNVWEKDLYSVEGNQTRTYLDINGNYLTAWQISGPYKQAGRDANSLFDIPFAPENQGNDSAKWRIIGREYFEKKTIKWNIIVDGPMEVEPGTGSIVSKQRFNDFKLHLEFRTPFMPEAREQKRGNSGVYLQGRYEVQILDSYGLKGERDECGAIYDVAAPSVNMCAPPLEWQSYDIDFCAPKFDEAGKKTKDAHITVTHNGVKIQDNVAAAEPTAYPLDYNVNQWGGILLQDHNNRVQYRNIWVVELPEGSCR